LTLVREIESERALTAWEEKHGKPHNNEGWWDLPESLDLNFITIIRNENVFKDFTSKTDFYTRTVLLTNRPLSLQMEVLNVLKRLNLSFDYYTFKTHSGEPKCSRIESFIKEYPTVTSIIFYDDLYGHFVECLPLMDKYQNINFDFVLVENNVLQSV
jgi:hypothetical protein